MQPKYKLIYQSLKKDILSQKYPIGSTLPSELSLAEKYQVSRITTKRALNELEQDKLVARKQGKGTIVIQNSISQDIHVQEILLVIPFANNYEFGDYMSGVLKEINNTPEYHLKTISNQEFKKDYANILTNVAGILYYVNQVSEDISVLSSLYLRNIPVVLLDKKILNFPLPCVMPDNLDGGKLATTAVLKGNSHPCFVADSALSEISVRSRYLGFLTTLKEQSITTDIPLITLNKKSDFETIASYISEKKIDAIVAENDVTAINIINYLHKKDIDIPNAVSIVGFDNIQAASLSYPSLTTINQDFNLIGAKATEILLNKIKDPNFDVPDTITIPVKLISRQSTK
ncbi:GntR family transcriptional regulator [Companilactobacillus nodensis]|uniref:Transcription regulator n=1 Tax=Companilactobacillus nodensis DSM 19682 = JCM 14932 = NBRC 107160 TaxID=1423775 RepID=A0A0R1KCU0_9LACO|nr:GntR family transcriptional regulator [Companilactobacillus nodensis]KRK81179.1 transcription regulator [Companilactobacillus nodensis DSM 19682 = JCM 14932 = NBRC 107160]